MSKRSNPRPDGLGKFNENFEKIFGRKRAPKKKKLTVLDLFSGIGGFSLGLERAGMHTVAFCENDPFCRQVLAKHWPDIPVHKNIEKLDGRKYKGTVDVVCGGFPCQPFSVAGEQRGTEDERALWPEMFRVIREVEPAWVIGENVPGIINMELDQVLSDLEDSGYACQTFVIPACAVDARHRRDRVWVIAQKNDSDSNRQRPHREDEHEQRKVEPDDRQISLIGSVCEVLAGRGNTAERPAKVMGNTKCAGFHQRRQSGDAEGVSEGPRRMVSDVVSQEQEVESKTVADAASVRSGEINQNGSGGDKRSRSRKGGRSFSDSGGGAITKNVADSVSESGRGGGFPTDLTDQGREASRGRTESLQPEDGETQPAHAESGSSTTGADVDNSISKGLEGLSRNVERGDKPRRIDKNENRSTAETGVRPSKPRRWLPEPRVGRVAHGVPKRVDRLKSLGNAVVPQVVEVLGNAIIAINEKAPKDAEDIETA